MSILILPDWMHTKDMYAKLMNDLDASVYAYKGDTLQNRAADLKRYLAKTNYDYVIGFGMGANLALRASTKEKLILVNPFYNGMSSIAKKFDASMFDTMCSYDWAIRLVCLFLVSKWKNITPELVNNIKSCNKAVELRLFEELRDDAYVAKKRHSVTSLILSKGDKLVPDENISKLEKDIENTKVFKIRGGHMSLLDNYTELISSLTEAMSIDCNL